MACSLFIVAKNHTQKNNRFPSCPYNSSVLPVSFQTENGISVSESGQPEDDDSYSVSGQFSYTAPDGVTYTVVYSAGEDGFQPQGDHLPTPVPTQYPTPELAEEEEEEEEEARASYEPQYERAIVGYRPRDN